MRIVAEGDRAKLPAGVKEVIAEGAMPNPLDAHAVQPLYAALLAQRGEDGRHRHAGGEPRRPRARPVYLDRRRRRLATRLTLSPIALHPKRPLD